MMRFRWQKHICPFLFLFLQQLQLTTAFPWGDCFPSDPDATPDGGGRWRRSLLYSASLSNDHRAENENDTSSLSFDEECNEMQYDVDIYVNKHVYLAAIPSSESSSCPIIVMEASDPTWGMMDEEVPEQRGGGTMHKQMHQLSLPGGMDPRRYFDLLPVGSFALSEIVQAFDEAFVQPPDNNAGNDHSNHYNSSYDLVLSNCGDFVAQMVTNLGVTFTPDMTHYIARRLLDTYVGIADEVRSNPSVIQLVGDIEQEEGVEDKNSGAATSDETLIRRLVERRVRHLYADEDDQEDTEQDPRQAGGIPCGKWYSKDCLGDSDIRYASDASDNLEDQSPLWKSLQGFYEVDSFALGPNGEKIPPTHVVAGERLQPWAFPYSYDSFKQFINITVTGSRYLEHSYHILPPSPMEFCDEPVPPGMLNSALPGVCGVNGVTLGVDRYGTSSYERDGSMIVLPFADSWYDAGRRREPYASIPVNEKTHFASYSEGGVLYQYTMACFDSTCNGWSLVMEGYDVSNADDTVTLLQTTRMTARRIATADAFVERINQVYEEFNILPDMQTPAPMSETSSFGFGGGCLSGLCPSEMVWCEYDPHCSISPYQEPAGSIRPGVYVLIVGVVLVLNGIVFAYLAIRLMKKRENALKEKFAVRIAETITLDGTDRTLTAENLAKEFNAIDADGSGKISKDELLEFFRTGKAGNLLSEHDFETMFAAIDIDKNGEIDFAEFMVFFNKCQLKYEEVKDQPALRRNRASYAVTNLRSVKE